MPRPFFVRLVTEDAGTKVLALVIAFLLWVAASFLGTRTLLVEEVPVEVTNLREDLALAAPLPAVDVKIRSPRALLRGRDPRELLRAFVDLAGRGLGAQSAAVAVSPTDPRVDILVVLPPRLNLTLDPIVQRSLPVAIVPDGTPAAGYAVGEGTVEPAKVEARGPLKKLQETRAIEVRVPVGGATAPIEGEFPLAPPEGITALTERVRVTLAIVLTEETRTLGVRVVTTGTVAPGYWVRAASAEPPVVTVRGPREALAERTFIETAPVEIADARSSLERDVPLALPAGVTVPGGGPTVRVRLDIAPLEGARTVSASVQVNEVPDGLRVTSVSPGSIAVTVRGSGEALGALRDGDVRAVLSASGREAGTFSVRPSAEHVRAPGGIQVVAVEGVEVSVTLEGS